ncbi:hypothetical protein Bca4012_057211 [Brassica carinata]
MLSSLHQLQRINTTRLPLFCRWTLWVAKFPSLALPFNDTEMCLRRNNNITLTSILDPNFCRSEAIGMEYELDLAGHHHHHTSVVSTIVFFSATLFIPLSLKIHIRDGFHEIL